MRTGGTAKDSLYDLESRRIAELAADGIRASGYEYIDFHSAPYNQSVAEDGSSRLQGHLLDARSTVGCPGALLFLQRIDSAVQDGIIAHSIPVPTRNRQSTNLVSNQELDLLESVVSETNTQAMVYGLRPANPFLSNVPALRAAKQWLRG